MIDTDKPSLDEAYLAHYGVKGMKWGRRKNDSGGGGTPRRQMSPESKQRLKKGALLAGQAAVIAGIAVMNNRQQMRLDSVINSASPATISTGKRIADNIAKQSMEDVMDIMAGRKSGAIVL